MSTLIIGHGRAYNEITYAPCCCNKGRLTPHDLSHGVLTDILKMTNVTYLDHSAEVRPDIVADVTEMNWWKKCPQTYDFIIDTIGLDGNHIRRSEDEYSVIREYDQIFQIGCLALMKKGCSFIGSCYLTVT
jgi:hypothetical protein